MGHLQKGNCRDKGPGSGSRGRVVNDRLRKVSLLGVVKGRKSCERVRGASFGS